MLAANCGLTAAIVAHDLGRKVADGTGAALVRWLAVSRMAVPYAEALAQTWSEVYMRPGASSHEIFVKGAYDSDVPVFVEAVARFGTETVESCGCFGTDDAPPSHLHLVFNLVALVAIGWLAIPVATVIPWVGSVLVSLAYIALAALGT